MTQLVPMSQHGSPIMSLLDEATKCDVHTPPAGATYMLIDKVSQRQGSAEDGFTIEGFYDDADCTRFKKFIPCIMSRDLTRHMVDLGRGGTKLMIPPVTLMQQIANRRALFASSKISKMFEGAGQLTSSCGAFTGIFRITPYDALLLLLNNKKNRHCEAKRVSTMMHGMTRGDWEVICQGIGIDVEGNLVDGQHRCFACMISMTPIEITVTADLSLTAKNKTDQGKHRHVGDTFALEFDGDSTEYPAPKIMSTALRCVFKFAGKNESLWSIDICHAMRRQYDSELQWLRATVNQIHASGNKVLVRGFDKVPALAGLLIAHQAYPKATQEVMDLLIKSLAGNSKGANFLMRYFSRDTKAGRKWDNTPAFRMDMVLRAIRGHIEDKLPREPRQSDRRDANADLPYFESPIVPSRKLEDGAVLDVRVIRKPVLQLVQDTKGDLPENVSANDMTEDEAPIVKTVAKDAAKDAAKKATPKKTKKVSP